MKATKTDILKARVGKCWDKKKNIVLFNLEFKAANSRVFRGYSVENFETKAEAEQALADHTSGKAPFGVSAVHVDGRYFFCKKFEPGKEDVRERDYMIGDIVPYKNTKGNIKLAKIIGFKSLENKRTWFYGIDTITNAKVFYPVHGSRELDMLSPKIGDVKEFSGSLRFSVNEVSYDARFSGLVYEKNNALISSYVLTCLNPYFERAVAMSVYRRVSENIVFDEAEILKLNDEEEYAVLIDNDLYPIIMSVEVSIATDPITFLKNQTHK